MISISDRRGRASIITLIAAVLVIATVCFVANFNTNVDGDNTDDLYIVGQPSDQFIHDRTNAVFTIDVVGADEYQWQYAEAGTNVWTDVTNGEGIDTGMLVISPSDYSDKEYMFRCVVENTSASVSTESQPAYLYLYDTATPTNENVHYVSSVEDMFNVGTGNTYKGSTWDLDDTYIQIADIDFTDGSNASVIELHVGVNKISVSYAINANDVTFTIKESNGGTFENVPDGTVYYNFGIATGSATISGGSLTINDDVSQYNGSEMVFSIGGIGSHGNYAVAIEVSNSASTVTKESYGLGNFISIGSFDFAGTKTFTGLYDGRGYSILGMETAKYTTARDYSGMFTYSVGTIQNVCLDGGSSVAIGPNSEGGAAGIIGCGRGYIYNSSNTGIVGSNYYSGGLFGHRQGSSDFEIRDCYNAGTIGGIYSGGIASNTYSLISNCYNTGNITGASAGGIVSTFSGGRGIDNSYNTGIIIGNDSAGGIMASANPSPATATNSIIDCYNSGDIYLYSKGTRYNSVAAGGIFGYANGHVSISGSYNLGKITVEDINNGSTQRLLYVGGIAGHIYESSTVNVRISDCYNLGAIDVTIDQSTPYNSLNIASIGGIVGTSKGNIISSYNEGEITVINGSNRIPKVGGIVGDGIDVDQSSNAGNISISSTLGSNSYAGGIAGTAVAISDCYNTGNISNVGTISAAGIATVATGVTDSYNIGSINSGSGNGIAGSGTITDSYYLTGTGIGSPSVSNATDLMNQISGTWDIPGKWTEVTGAYPALTVLRSSSAVFIIDPADVTANDGTEVRFSVAIDSHAVYIPYQWYSSTDGVTWSLIAGATASDYFTIADSLTNNFMLYKCVLTFSDGTKMDSRPATLTVVNDLKIIHTEVCLTVNGPGTGGYVYPGGILYTTSNSMEFTIKEMAGYTLTKVTIGGMDGTDVIGSMTKDLDGWHYTLSLTGIDGNYIWAFFTPGMTATINVKLDSSTYDGFTGTMNLKQGDSIKYSSDQPSASGVYTFANITPGDYDVFMGSTDTGMKVTPASTVANVQYYTVTFTHTIAGTATADSYMTTTNSESSPIVVLSGTKFEIIAAGRGAAGTGAYYRYAWIDSGGSTQPVENASFPVIVTDTRTVTCEITGYNGKVKVEVNVLLNQGTYTGYTGTIELRQGGDTKYSSYTNVNGKFEINDVQYGDYDVYANGVDTGEKVTGAFPLAIVDYYSVVYTVADSIDGVSGSSIESTQVASNGAVLDGTIITITVTSVGAMGQGAYYTYLWTDTSNPGPIADSKTYIVTVDSARTIKCVVTGHHGTVDVRVMVRLNDAPDTTYAGTIELWQNGVKKQSPDISGSGDFRFIDIPYGDYTVYANNVNTGQTVFGESPPQIYVDYYSVDYSVVDSPAGTSSGSTIDSAQVVNGGTVLKGTGIVIIVTPAGASGTAPIYEYSWTNYAITTNVLSIQNVTAKVETICTVTGTDNDAAAKVYTITANSDPGAYISPAGTVTVERGDSKTFTYGAVEGYSVSDVIIDGVSHPELISAGTYTFTNVMMNHTITIKNTRTEITLNVEIIKGEGRVEYSVNGGAFTVYTGQVVLNEGSNLVLRAYADDGYTFTEWSGDVISKESEISIAEINTSVHLEVSFEEEDAAEPLLPSWSWYLIGAALILLAALLILLFAFYRRTYEVIKIESSVAISGKDRARRKKNYTFQVEGSSVKVSYRIGENGAWKIITPDAEGRYVIPKEDVIDKITIEA